MAPKKRRIDQPAGESVDEPIKKPKTSKSAAPAEPEASGADLISTLPDIQAADDTAEDAAEDTKDDGGFEQLKIEPYSSIVKDWFTKFRANIDPEPIVVTKAKGFAQAKTFLDFVANGLSTASPDTGEANSVLSGLSKVQLLMFWKWARSTFQASTKNARSVESRKKKGGRTLNKSEQDSVVAESRGTSERITALVTPLLESADPALANARKMANAMKAATLRRVVSATPPSPEDEVHAATFLQNQPVPGRNVVAKRCRKAEKKNQSGQVWEFTFKDEGSTQALHSTDGKISIHFEQLPSDSSATQLEALHQEFCRIYNTWPHLPLTSLSREATIRQWTVIALSNTNQRPSEIPAPVIDGPRYAVKICFFDTQGGTGERTIRATPTDTAMATVQVPTGLPIYYQRSYTSTRQSQFQLVTASEKHYLDAPKGLKEGTSTKASQHRCQDALRWIALQLDGLVTSQERMDELVTLHRVMVGLEPSKARGIYGNEGPLYYCNVIKQTGTTEIAPSRAVANDVLNAAIRRFGINIGSLNATRAVPVLDTMLQLYTDGKDIREVWIEAAKISDDVNAAIAEGVPPSSRCDCDDAHTSVVLHACEGCAKPVICGTRGVDTLGRLVCTSCTKRDQASLRGGRVPGETLLQYIVRSGTKASLIRECAVRDVDFDSTFIQAMWKEISAQLMAKCPTERPTKYDCAYSGGTHDVGEERPRLGKNPSQRRVIPTSATVDAALPEGDPKYKGFKHSPGNLEVVTSVCQYMKYVYLPGAVHEISQFLREAKSGPPTPDRINELLDRLLEITMVALKRPYINQMPTGTAEEKYAKIYAEMVSGKPTPSETGPWEQQALRYVSGKVPSVEEGKLWNDEKYVRSQKCAASIGKRFGVEVPQLEDGTYWPYLWHTDSTVHRNSIAMLCRERLTRMRTVCNKKWDTDETDESIYAEIIFQFCASHTTKPELKYLSDKYGDRLRLPLTMWIHSALRFSVAHREHGFGMLTGWPAEPTDVEERIKNDEKNNMLIESWQVNSTKLDMADDYYSDMDDIMTSIDFTKNGMEKYYDPTKSPPTDINPAFADMATLPLDDVEGMPFDSDEADGPPDTGSAEGGKAAEEDESGPETSTVGGTALFEDTEMLDGSTADLMNRVDTLRGLVVDLPTYREVFRTNPRVVELLFEMQTSAAIGDGKEFGRADKKIMALLDPGEDGE